MKYCSHCGRELLDDAVICPGCGCKCGKVKGKSGSGTRNDTIVIINKIFLVLTCIAAGFTLIPLIWMIPMTLKYFRAVRDDEPLSTAYMVCVLLFVNMIPGILMLVDENN